MFKSIININIDKFINLNLGTKPLLDTIRGITCNLQMIFPQYLTLAAKKHTELREYYQKNPTNSPIIEEKYRNLTTYLNTNLDNSFNIARNYLLQYFKPRSKYEVRVCVKAPYEKDKIVDLYRRDSSPCTSFKIHENTAFKYIKDTGRYYLCNNIPEQVIKGSYRNLRINSDLVRSNYRMPNMIKSAYYRLRGQPERDHMWEACWDIGSNDRPPPESCYKSTLVVPMTLINANFEQEFQNYLFGEDFSKECKYEKLMFGFLCIDHRHSKFFEIDKDPQVGYIFADLLSLFLVSRRMFTTNSDTYKEIENLLKTMKGGFK